MNNSHIVIIGNGVAGVSAAEEARTRDRDAKITIIGNEGIPYYYRASLTEWIAEELSDKSLTARTSDFYHSMAIDQIEGTVAQVYPEEKQLLFEDGRRMTYTTLCIATGGKPNTIHFEGLDENQIITYRNIADARLIKSKLSHNPHVLIIGGGVLGLELAAGLKRIGVKNVAIIEYFRHIARPIMDEPLARWLEARIQTDGFHLFLNDTIDHVEGKTAILKSGQVQHFDLLIEAVGITPSFPKVTDLDIGKGIRVDEFGQTNLPGIFACGDCTETFIHSKGKWQTTRIWLDCARQGRAAGASMAGGKHPYVKKAFFNCSDIYLEQYSYIGDPHGEGEIYYYHQGSTHRKVRLVDDVLAGAVLINNRQGTIPIFESVGMDLSGFGEELAHPDFDWNTISGENWDYRFY